VTGDRTAEAGYRERFVNIVRTHDFLWEVCEAVRDADPPDWLITAGVLRNAVWDHLHGYPFSPPRDVDVGFFDYHDLSSENDKQIEIQLAQRIPGVPWEARNQAAIHLWFKRKWDMQVEPFSSTSEAVGTFPETATCVGIHLQENDVIDVEAPFGLEDLFQLVLRRNPRRVSPEMFRQRVAEKRFLERWPQLRLVDD
jgi:uncharacterized protein